MSNPNPPLENLILGRGKRPKLGHETVCMRMSQATREQLEQIAESYQCFYGGKPWIAGLLEKIGSGELEVVPSPPYRSLSNIQGEEASERKLTTIFESHRSRK
jgi:hypothetical protein